MEIINEHRSEAVSYRQRQKSTDNEGRQGMGGVAGVGSSTEKMLGYVAEAVFENCGQLDNQQLDDIISWIQLYKS